MQLRTEIAEQTRETALRLLAYCRARDWAGYDPYDGLNSRLFKALPFLNFRLARLALTQFNKRCPVNLRPLLLVPPTQNPKGLALFLSALVRLAKAGLAGPDEELIYLAERIAQLRSPETRYWCWGYSFPWQTRMVLVPRGSPNLVCTCFVGNALLDLFDHRPREAYLEMATSAADFIVKELYYTEGAETASFHYPLTGNRAKVHNANLLAAAFLCRASSYSGESRFLEPARRAAAYSAGRQQPDGSWIYGELPTQQWIDNFHTGYNLCALRQIGLALGTDEFEPALRRGYRFYMDHFFRRDGAPRYFHDRDYPVDGHCVAQSLITLMAMRDYDAGSERLAAGVFGWARRHLWDERGFFYYRQQRFGRLKTSYMRWVQAWMLLALTETWEYAIEIAGAMFNGTYGRAQGDGATARAELRQAARNGPS